MIHQLIFARPRPGMSEREFQDYWVNVHAQKYARTIPQIRRYMVCTRVDVAEPEQDPLFSGVAEIWLENEADQLASLQSKEFLDGARLDEPRWAAFWATLALDTDAHTLIEGPPPTGEPSWIKLYTLLKRKEGLPLQQFRDHALQVHAGHVSRLPGLRRYLQCQVRDSAYVVGESRFDAVEQWWFDDVAALRDALDSSIYREQVDPDFDTFVESKYRFSLAAREHWVIGPGPR
jgi:hypothetical protein